MSKITLRHDQWLDEMKKRYPESHLDARFVCPSCGFVQGWPDFAALGMGEDVIPTMLAFSCIGRYWQGEARDRVQQAFTGGPGPCNYAGGGLFRISPILVTVDNREWSVFDFADDPLAPQEVATNG